MAFVQPQLYPIPFEKGLDTKRDPNQVLAGNLVELTNGQFSKTGQLNKRYGYDVLGTGIEGGGNITTAVGVDSFNNELILFDGNSIYSYVEATGTWLSRGTAISVIAKDKQIIRRNNDQQVNPDVAYLNGVEVYAWEDTRGGIRYSVIDSVTKAFCVSDSSVNASTVSKPKCIAFNGVIYIFYSDAANGLYYQAINPFNPTVIAPSVTVITDGYTGFAYDVSVIGNKMFVGYQSNATASGRINLFSYDNTLTKSSVINVESTVSRAATAVAGCMNVVGDGLTNVWITWSTGATIRTACYSYALATVLASTLVDTAVVKRITGVESLTVGVLELCYEVNAVAALNHFVKVATITQAGTITAIGTIRGVGLASKAFKTNNNLYVNLAFESTNQSTYFTANLNKTPISAPIAKIASSVGGGLRTNNTVSEIPETSTSIFLWANSIKGKIISEANFLFSVLGVNSTTLDYNNSNKFLSVTQSNNLLIVGGVLQSYDGVSVVEHGFHIYPEGVTAIAAGSDGFLSTGSYIYQVVYEWTDNWGQIQRSSPSDPLTVAVTANNHVTLTIPTLRLTAKQGTRSAVSIVVYRSQVNETTLNQVSSTLAPLKNDPTADTVQFVDILSDASALPNALIYTSGNIVNNIAPPANKLIASYQDRVFVSGLEDPNLAWFSQNRFDNSNYNTIPAEFAAELTMGVDPRGGEITALGLLNANLIIFKKTAIFIQNGDGPDATGNDGFANATMISSDVGCNNPNSVVIVPNAIMFQSDKGIYQLTTGQTPQYIGAPVERYNANVITSATVIPDANQVVFTSLDGPALVYDYYAQQWSTWDNHQAEDSCIYDNTFCFAKANGKVYKQNKNVFTDGGSPVYLSWTTPDLSFANLQGYQQAFRVYILGTYRGPHNLIVSVAFDGNAAFTETTTVAASQAITTWGSDGYWGSGSVWGGEYIPYEFRIDFKRQRCTSIRLRITDDQSSGYNEGYSISALTFEVGALPGGSRLPTSSTYGSR